LFVAGGWYLWKDGEFMEEGLRISIEPMREEDIEETVEVISDAMNRDEAKWAGEGVKFYFACKQHGIDSGREYYVWRHEGRICGLVGLHRYVWGPEENVWLSWFAVRPEYQRKGAGSALMEAIKERAIKAGYKKFLIETYENPTFEKAHSFYKAQGFSRIGRVENYLPDGSAMIVFGTQLEE
jgi:GNAT superfamily N-acetyltransferase